MSVRMNLKKPYTDSNGRTYPVGSEATIIDEGTKKRRVVFAITEIESYMDQEMVEFLFENMKTANKMTLEEMKNKIKELEEIETQMGHLLDSLNNPMPAITTHSAPMYTKKYYFKEFTEDFSKDIKKAIRSEYNRLESKKMLLVMQLNIIEEEAEDEH